MEWVRCEVPEPLGIGSVNSSMYHCIWVHTYSFLYYTWGILKMLSLLFGFLWVCEFMCLSLFKHGVYFSFSDNFYYFWKFAIAVAYLSFYECEGSCTTHLLNVSVWATDVHVQDLASHLQKAQGWPRNINVNSSLSAHQIQDFLKVSFLLFFPRSLKNSFASCKPWWSSKNPAFSPMHCSYFQEKDMCHTNDEKQRCFLLCPAINCQVQKKPCRLSLLPSNWRKPQPTCAGAW